MQNIQLQYAIWQDLPLEVQSLFNTFLGGDPALGRAFYELYFYGYNIAHEVGHVLRAVTGTRTDWMWDEEVACNRFAVAYWRERGAGELLEKVAGCLHTALAHLPDPCPPGEDRAGYFNHHYQEMGNNPAAYGHYQFSMVQAALKDTSSLPEMMPVLFGVHPREKLEMASGYNPDRIHPELPRATLQDIRQTLACLGLALPPIALVCRFSPALQFVSWEQSSQQQGRAQDD